MAIWSNPHVQQEWRDPKLHAYYETTAMANKEEGVLKILTRRQGGGEDRDDDDDVTAVFRVLPARQALS